MKVVFLDVDGVLNTETPTKEQVASGNLIDEDKVSLLQGITGPTGASVVLHSGWRSWLGERMEPLRPESQLLVELLQKYHIPLGGKDPRPHHQRDPPVEALQPGKRGGDPSLAGYAPGNRPVCDFGGSGPASGGTAALPCAHRPQCWPDAYGCAAGCRNFNPGTDIRLLGFSMIPYIVLVAGCVLSLLAQTHLHKHRVQLPPGNRRLRLFLQFPQGALHDHHVVPGPQLIASGGIGSD